jgi:hypothetical protein
LDYVILGGGCWVRGLRGLKAGRIIRTGQKGIRIVAPDTIDDGNLTSIKHLHVFDVSQTQERTQRASA